MAKNRNLLIIDGHNFLFKAYGAPFKAHSKKGTPLHVTMVFLSLIRRAMGTIDGCTNIAVVFDSKFKTSNHKILKTYKANRKHEYGPDDNPFLHLPYIYRCLEHLKVQFYEKPGIEADDVIASLAHQFTKKYKTGRAYIASTDSDFYQLLSRRVNQVVLRKGGVNEILKPKDIKQKLKIYPKHYVYFKSLVGDHSDNIPGVPKVGPVKAGQIINKKVRFDLKPYLKLLKQNEKLIRLNIKHKFFGNLRALQSEPELFSFKHSELFESLEF